jgi:hypothetical protein
MDLFDGYFMDLFGGCLDLLVEFWTLDVLWVFLMGYWWRSGLSWWILAVGHPLCGTWSWVKT